MSLREHPFAHTGLKIVSIALAVVLWMMVSSQRASVERGLRIPLELQNLPENLEMVDPPQEAVDVRVRGTADALGRIAPSDLVATVPYAVAREFAGMSSWLAVSLPPFEITGFDLKLHWHRRFDNEQRNRWLREQVADVLRDDRQRTAPAG